MVEAPEPERDDDVHDVPYERPARPLEPLRWRRSVPAVGLPGNFVRLETTHPEQGMQLRQSQLQFGQRAKEDEQAFGGGMAVTA
jgi:hypothetical protein